MRLRIVSPAHVARANTDVELNEPWVLSVPVSVDGQLITDNLSDALLDAGVIGGEICLCRVDERPTVEISFWAPSPVSDESKQALLLEVMAQWSDGLGENGFPLTTPRGELVVFPCDDASQARLLEDDDGRHLPAVSRVARFARDGLLAELRAALDEGDDVNGTLGGYSGLHLAIMGKHLAVATLLLERGISANQRDKDGDSPLFLVALSNRLDDDDSTSFACTLLAHGAAKDEVQGGRTAAYYAEIRNKIRLLAVLTS